MTAEEISNCKLATLASGNLRYTTVRVCAEIAREWMLENTHVINKGTQYPIQLRQLGLNVFEAKLNQRNWEDTMIISNTITEWLD